MFYIESILLYENRSLNYGMVTEISVLEKIEECMLWKMNFVDKILKQSIN